LTCDACSPGQEFALYRACDIAWVCVRHFEFPRSPEWLALECSELSFLGPPPSFLTWLRCLLFRVVPHGPWTLHGSQQRTPKLGVRHDSLGVSRLSALGSCRHPGQKCPCCRSSLHCRCHRQFETAPHLMDHSHQDLLHPPCPLQRFGRVPGVEGTGRGLSRRVQHRDSERHEFVSAARMHSHRGGTDMFLPTPSLRRCSGGRPLRGRWVPAVTALSPALHVVFSPKGKF